MNDDNQLGLDFSGEAGGAVSPFEHLENEKRLLDLPETDGAGYEFFVSEHREMVERFNEKFGAMLERRVRVKLFAFDEEFTGKLLLNTLLVPEAKGDDVPLHIGRVKFDLRDMEHCFLLEGEE